VEPTSDGWALRERVAGVPSELGGSLQLTEDEGCQLHQLLYKIIGSLDAPATR
jgi:hypothetical protein